MISRVATSEISIFQQVPVPEQASLNLTVGNPEDRFLRDEAQIQQTRVSQDVA